MSMNPKHMFQRKTATNYCRICGEVGKHHNHLLDEQDVREDERQRVQEAIAEALANRINQLVLATRPTLITKLLEFCDEVHDGTI